MNPSREVWFPDQVCHVLWVDSLAEITLLANSSGVIKMMDVFFILQEATSDDGCTLDGLLLSDEKEKICKQEIFVNHGKEEGFFFQ